jgi:hypothetical protein
MSCWEVWNPAGADYVSRLTVLIPPPYHMTGVFGELTHPLISLSLCLFLVRSLNCLELFSNSHLSIFGYQATCTASDYHENHLILVDSNLIDPLCFSLREYTPWEVTGKPVKLATMRTIWSKWTQAWWPSLRSFETLASDNKDQPPCLIISRTI